MKEEERLVTLGLWSRGVMGEGSLRRLLRTGVSWGVLLEGGGRVSEAVKARLGVRGRAGFEEAVAEGVEVWRRRGEGVLRRVEEAGGEALVLGEGGYPERLERCKQAPPVLSVRGARERLEGALVAVVGTRRASRRGLALCGRLVEALVREGYGVASGGAKGIDAVAHGVTLERGAATVWVCGTGLDRVYPRGHRRLFEEVAARGVIVSQFPPGTGVGPGAFPRRNTTIAGLSEATLVVEAPEGSGALYTARASRRMERPVLVASGEAMAEGFAGGLRLVERGEARLVHDLSSLRAGLGGGRSGELWGGVTREAGEALEGASESQGAPGEAARVWTGIEGAVLDQLEGGPRSRAELMVAVGGDGLASALLGLELDGIIRRGLGGVFERG